MLTIGRPAVGISRCGKKTAVDRRSRIDRFSTTVASSSKMNGPERLLA